jgi:transcriptional pleiotropic regulator of transition state genes
MKSTGIVRRIDDLGRVVIPKELREVLNINIKDSLEIFTENKTIILKKYNPGCVFCEKVDNVVRFKQSNICSNCLKELQS